jgi:ABC-2 type transport system permease protein
MSLATEPVFAPSTGLGASLGRIGSLVKRYVYLVRSSWVRVVELVYWPFLQMVMWGFLQQYLAETTTPFAQAAGLLIGAILLWEILFRAKIGFSICFLEEMWSRNFGQLLTSPLRPNELILGLSAMSLIRLAIGMVPVTIAAYLFFGFNILGLGLGLAAFFSILVLTGWALALISSGIILRWGLGAEELAWSLGFVLLPLSCVFYPVAILPEWLQPVALAIPATHVFEGMRAILLEGVFDTESLWRALGLNAIYLVIGYTTFRLCLRSAKINGSLLQLGE